MNNERSDFLFPMDPLKIVKELTREDIEWAIQAYAEKDADWLKFYHFGGEVDITVFNQFQTKHIEELKELDELDNSKNFDRNES